MTKRKAEDGVLDVHRRKPKKPDTATDEDNEVAALTEGLEKMKMVRDENVRPHSNILSGLKPVRRSSQ